MQIVVTYGMLSTISCLAGVTPTSDLLDEHMIAECGPVLFANYCLGILVLALYTCKLAIIETGLADIHSLMTLNVPRGLKFIAINILGEAAVALYFQSAADFDMDIWVALGLLGAFLLFYSNATLGLAVALPLKAIAEGPV